MRARGIRRGGRVRVAEGRGLHKLGGRWRKGSTEGFVRAIEGLIESSGMRSGVGSLFFWKKNGFVIKKKERYVHKKYSYFQKQKSMLLRGVSIRHLGSLFRIFPRSKTETSKFGLSLGPVKFQPPSIPKTFKDNKHVYVTCHSRMYCKGIVWQLVWELGVLRRRCGTP